VHAGAWYVRREEARPLRTIRSTWLLPLVIATCLWLDSSPFVPGVFVFDTNQSVDGIETEDLRIPPDGLAVVSPFDHAEAHTSASSSGSSAVPQRHRLAWRALAR
jgi:hypothetical protein